VINPWDKTSCGSNGSPHHGVLLENFIRTLIGNIEASGQEEEIIFITS